MKFFRLLALLFLPLLFVGCAPTAQEQADYAAVHRSGVDPAVYDKIVHGDALSLWDIQALAKAHVSDAVVLRYLRNQQTIYSLNATDVQNLLNAGVSRSVVDYMMSTPQMYQPTVVPVYVGVGYGPYYGPGPYYYGGYYHGGPYRRCY